MSLAIEAGSRATFVTSDLDMGGAEGDVAVYDAGFPERLDGLREGIYHFNGETFGFDVGGATEYFGLLRQLSDLALGVDLESVRSHPELYQGKPFIELIHFSDNEGAIGPRTSRKLAHDFASYAGRLREHVSAEQGQTAPEAAELVELYDNFHHAFELASDEGLVVFQ